MNGSPRTAGAASIISILLLVTVFACEALSNWMPLEESKLSGGAIPLEFSVVAGGADPELYSEELVVDCVVPGVSISELIRDGISYDLVDIPGAGHTMDAGKPAVPVAGRFINVPTGARAQVEVLDSDAHSFQDYFLFPAQPLAPDSADAPSGGAVVVDEDCYGTDAFYPTDVVKVGGEGVIRGASVAVLRVYPVQFNPVRRELRIHSRLRIQVTFEMTDQASAVQETHVPGVQPRGLGNLLLNTPQASTRGETVTSSREEGSFLIITPPEFKEAAQTLAHWKNQKGIVTDVLTTQETGETVEAVQSAIRNAYRTWSPPLAHVLLLGDAEFIPCHYETDHPYNDQCNDCQGRIGTDLYYATVDGSDYYPDIGIGRLSVDTLQEAERRIQAIIDYERDPPADSEFYSRAACVSCFEDDNLDGYEDRRFVRTAEDIHDYLEESGYNVDRIYYAQSDVEPAYWSSAYWPYTEDDPIPEDLRKPAFPWLGSDSQIRDALDEGRFLIAYRGHGLRTAWDNPTFRISDIQALQNGERRPLVFSINCLTGWFDNEIDDPVTKTSVEATAFSEVWERHSEGGAIGVVAATRMSYSHLNDRLAWGWMDAIWPAFEAQYSDSDHRFDSITWGMGNVLNYGKYYLASLYEPTSLVKVQFEVFHWFGDPTLQPWTESPGSLHVTHPTEIAVDASFVQVSVDQPGALICISRNGKILGKAVSSQSGTESIPLSMSLSESDMLDIIVTGRDLRPYEGICRVAGQGPVLHITSHSDGQTVSRRSIRLEGTASDSGRGNDGIQKVLVNGRRASADIVSGSLSAYWSCDLELQDGANSIEVTAYDASPSHYTTTRSLTLYHCSYSIFPPSASFGPESATGSVDVESRRGCPWTARSQAPWITVLAGETEEGSGSVQYRVSANTTSSPRTGAVEIAGERFSVIQSADECTCSISPKEQAFSPRGGTGSIYVSASKQCSWSVESQASWITVLSGDGGTGDGTVRYKVSPVDGSKKGIMRVAGHNFQVSIEDEAPLFLNALADFSATPLIGRAPLDVEFTDESRGEIIGWEWDFGDGATSSEQNPAHNYSSPGAYTVQLTVTNPEGTHTTTKTNYVTVTETQPHEKTPPMSVGGAVAGAHVEEIIDTEQTDEVVLHLSCRAVDAPGRLYIGLETVNVPAWERYLWLRPLEKQEPPYVVLAKVMGEFTPGAEANHYFSGILRSDAEDLTFELGDIAGLQGYTVNFKSWYLENGKPFLEDNLKLIQVVQLSFL